MGTKGTEISHTCNFCKKSYVYPGTNIDGSLYCQHCGKIFYPHSPKVSQRKEPDTATWLTTKRSEGIRIICPKCNASYIYRKHALTGNEMIQCQNCAAMIEGFGEKIVVVEEIELDDELPKVDICILLLAVVIFLNVPWIISLPIIACIFYTRINQKRKENVKKGQGTGLGW